MEKIKAIMNDNLDYQRHDEADAPLSARELITFTNETNEELERQYEELNN